MKIALVVLLACSGNYLDPDGEDIYFYEECLNMKKFNDEQQNVKNIQSLNYKNARI